MMCIYIYIHCNYGLEVKLEHLHTFAVYSYIYIVMFRLMQKAIILSLVMSQCSYQKRGRTLYLNISFWCLSERFIANLFKQLQSFVGLVLLPDISN